VEVAAKGCHSSRGDGSDCSLFMAAVMLGGVFVGFALHPGFVFGFANHFLAFAELDSVFDGEALAPSATSIM